MNIDFKFENGKLKYYTKGVKEGNIYGVKRDGTKELVKKLFNYTLTVQSGLGYSQERFDGMIQDSYFMTNYKPSWIVPIINNNIDYYTALLGLRFVWTGNFETQFKVTEGQVWRNPSNDNYKEISFNNYLGSVIEYVGFFDLQNYSDTTLRRPAIVDIVIIEKDNEIDINSDYIKYEFSGINILNENFSIQLDFSKSVILYNNISESNRVDKTDFLNNSILITGEFRNDVSIIEPNVIFELENVNYNYCYIWAFNRYYYVDDIINIGSNLYSFYLRCDVLMTYKKHIKELDCVVDRQEFNYNKYIYDDLMPVSPISKSFIIEPSVMRHFFETTSGYGYSSENVINCVLALSSVTFDEASYLPSCRANTIYLCTRKDAGRFISYINKATWVDNLAWIKQNPSEFFMSVRLYPFNLKAVTNDYVKVTENNSGETPGVYIGDTFINTSQQIYGTYYTPNYKSYVEKYELLPTVARLTVAKFSSSDLDTLNDFTWFYPNAKIELFLPFYGFVDIDLKPLLNGFTVTYNVDITTGSCIAKITDSSNNIFSTYSFNIGVECPVTLTNASEVSRQLLMESVNLVSSVAGMTIGNKFSKKINSATYSRNLSLGGRNAKSATRDYRINEMDRKSSMIQKTLNTIGNASSDFINASQQKFSSGQFNSSMDSWVYDECFIKIVKQPLVYNNTKDFAHQVGRPSEYIGKLKNIRGYTLVSSVHMDYIDNALETELDEIENLLKDGVIL